MLLLCTTPYNTVERRIVMLGRVVPSHLHAAHVARTLAGEYSIAPQALYVRDKVPCLVCRGDGRNPKAPLFVDLSWIACQP